MSGQSLRTAAALEARRLRTRAKLDQVRLAIADLNKRKVPVTVSAVVLPHPRRVHRPGTRSGLATRDHPADPVQVDAVERSEQRLAGQEPDRSRHLPELVDAVGDVVVLHRHAHLHVRRPRQVGGQAAVVLAPFSGQQRGRRRAGAGSARAATARARWYCYTPNTTAPPKPPPVTNQLLGMAH